MGCVYRHKNRPTWWVKYRSAGRWQYESSHSAKREDATRLLKLREGDSAKGVPITSQVGRLRFEDAVTDLTNFHKARGRKTKKMERRIAMHLATHFTRRKMAEITVADIEAYRAQRNEAGAAVATVNHELGLLKQMFRLAVRAGKLMTQPTIELPEPNNARQGFLEHQQFESVLRHLPEPLQPVLTVAYYTGWRVKSELLRMQWSQVDRAVGQLRLEPGTTKNKDGRTFPYARVPGLKAALDRQWIEHERLKKAGKIVP